MFAPVHDRDTVFVELHIASPYHVGGEYEPPPYDIVSFCALHEVIQNRARQLWKRCMYHSQFIRTILRLLATRDLKVKARVSPNPTVSKRMPNHFGRELATCLCRDTAPSEVETHVARED